MSSDPTCIKCGRPRSYHNYFGGWGYLCHNGSNTFLSRDQIVEDIKASEARKVRP